MENLEWLLLVKDFKANDTRDGSRYGRFRNYMEALVYDAQTSNISEALAYFWNYFYDTDDHKNLYLVEKVMTNYTHISRINTSEGEHYAIISNRIPAKICTKFVDKYNTDRDALDAKRDEAIANGVNKAITSLK